MRGPGDIAGTGSDFTVDLITQAQNASGNQLSASHGYRTGLNLPLATAFGPGKPDPDVPGLVVTLCTTPGWRAERQSRRGIPAEVGVPA